MSKLYRALRIAILSLVVFSALSGVSESYAYWASSIAGDADTVVASVSMGTWTFYEPWSSSGSYLIGDQVQHNGVIYEAKKDNPTKEPGVSGGWTSQWTEIGPL